MINKTRRSLLGTFGAAAIGISFTGVAACARKSKLNFLNWDTYIGKTSLADFQAETGTQVVMSLIANNDELFAKVKTGNSGYDVIVPSNDYVTRLSQAGLLEELDHSKIPNLKNVDPAFLNPEYDPGRKYSVPYTWLVLGIGYNQKKVPAGFVPDSWKYVFESDMFKKRIALLSESTDLIRLAAKYKGHSLNALTPEVISEAEALLTKQVKADNILAFHNDDGQDMLARGDVDIVIEYNGDIAQKNRDNPDLKFVVPKEGSEINSDTWCIMKGTPRLAEAHAFLNFMLDAKHGADISKTILYPTPNVAAKALMPLDYQSNPIIFPPKDLLDKCEYGRFPGQANMTLIEESVTRVRAAAKG